MSFFKRKKKDASFEKDYKDYMKALAQNGLLLKDLAFQTKELCLIAVRQNGLALQHVKEQDDEICKTAFFETPLAANFIKNEKLKKELMEKDDRILLNPDKDIDGILASVEKISGHTQPTTTFDEEMKMRSR